MRRLFWMSVGAAAGIYGVRRVRRAADAVTPEGLSRGVNTLAHSVRGFATDVRLAMAEREAELSEALGLDTTRDQPPQPGAQVVIHPTHQLRGLPDGDG